MFKKREATRLPPAWMLRIEPLEFLFLFLRRVGGQGHTKEDTAGNTYQHSSYSQKIEAGNVRPEGDDQVEHQDGQRGIKANTE